MIIRKSTKKDIDQILALFEFAKEFMKQTGNGNQWVNGYPQRELIEVEIEKGNSYVFENDDEKIVGVFSFIQAKDPNYLVIEKGEWINDEPYGVIHRLASNGEVKGLADKCIEWCFDKIPNIRVDTHKDNIIMQKIFERNGFEKCGVIYVENGTPRLAYQKIK